MSFLGLFNGSGNKQSDAYTTSQDIQQNANFTGASGSAPSTATYTPTNTSGSNNQVIGAGGIRSDVSITGYGNSVSYTDSGAVSKALDAAMRGVELANNTAGQAVASSTSLLGGIFDAQATSTKQLSSALETVKTTDLRAIAIGVLGVVGLVVAFRYSKG